MLLAPIIIPTYNRPNHLRQTLLALAKNKYAKESNLFVFSDGAKNPSDKNKVFETRKIISNISGFNKVTTILRRKNFGIMDNTIEALNQIFDKFEKAIILEDDLITSQYFLEFVNNSLQRYYLQSKVMQISGFMYPIVIEKKHDAFFLPFISSLGWATWKRSWKHYDHKISQFYILKNNPLLRYNFNLRNSFDYYSLLEQQLKGKKDWDIRWQLSVFMKKGIILYPVKSLIKNIGNDGSGNHIVLQNFDIELSKNFEPIHLPKSIRINKNDEEMVYSYFRSIRTNRIEGFIKKLVIKYEKYLRFN